jgi:uncharacterized protein DUF1629
MTKPVSVFELRYSEGFEWLLPVNDTDFDILAFDGQPRARSWKPVSMERLKTSERGQPLAPSDFPACSGGDMLIISGEARLKLQSELELYGELLPLACEDGDFWTLNVTRLIDALDESNSELVRASDTGAILMIRKHVFRPTELGSAHVFLLRQMVRGSIYVTDPFVDLVTGSGLKGIEFLRVWSSN